MKDAAMPGPLVEQLMPAVADGQINAKPDDPQLRDGVLPRKAEQGDEGADRSDGAEQNAGRDRLVQVDIGQDAADCARERERQQIVLRRGVARQRYGRTEAAANGRHCQMRIEVRHSYPPLATI